MSKLLPIILLLLLVNTAFANDKGLARKQATDTFIQGNKVAILVGVSRYNQQNTGFTPLRYAAKDVEVLAKTLSTKGYEVIKITDHNANKALILNRIEQAAKLIKPQQGTLVFAFSGHGYAETGQPTRLATFDTIANKLSTTGLSVDDVVNAIRHTGVKRAMLFIDACRNNPTLFKSGPITGPRKYNPGEGIQILYSTRRADVSIEHPSLQQGVFSYFVNRGLLGQAEEQGVVTFASLARYVEREVPLWSNRHMPVAQQPFRAVAGEQYGDFVLASRQQQVARFSTSRLTREHSHNGRSHSHPLPGEGINHQHGGAIAARPATTTAIVNQPNILELSRDSIEPEMVFIKGGTFMMGSPANEVGRGNTERQHSVTVRNFYLGKTEVTNEEYAHCVSAGVCEPPLWQESGSKYNLQTGTDKSYRGLASPKKPVVSVSLHNAQSYAQWLSDTTGKRYGLPTEAQWEYAARAGAQTAYPWGNQIGKNQANCDGCGSQWDLRTTAPVGSFSANRFGLHDMVGNVWEWTCSAFDENYNGSEQRCVTNSDMRKRVFRGGSWFNMTHDVRSAIRSKITASFRGKLIGFRVSRAP